MCGICGIASTRAVDPERVARMSRSLVHRGPDPAGDQPIGNEDASLQVVQNGEIYNHEELRRTLARAGHRFATRCDTEVLAHAYEEWGDDFARRLRGMFAAAIWDSRARRLVLARDRFGIKPLYYRAADGALAFAS